MVRNGTFVAAVLMAVALVPAVARTIPGQPGGEGAVMVAAKPPAVRDSRARTAADDTAAKAAAVEDPRLTEYIEMHGRAIDYTGRASFMPWSALKQMAN